jgi:hypothetical protein
LAAVETPPSVSTARTGLLGGAHDGDFPSFAPSVPRHF